MKTALEWLADELKKNHGIDLRLYDEFEKAKEMEKQQLESCYNHGSFSIIDNGHGDTFKEYCTKTFKSDEQE